MPLMTGKSVPHPHGRMAAGEEIVRACRKRQEHANPLVLGSNPSGPTNFDQALHAARSRGLLATTAQTCGNYLMRRHSSTQHRPGNGQKQGQDHEKLSSAATGISGGNRRRARARAECGRADRARRSDRHGAQTRRVAAGRSVRRERAHGRSIASGRREQHRRRLAKRRGTVGAEPRPGTEPGRHPRHFSPARPTATFRV